MFDLAPSKTADLFDQKTEGNFVAKDGITDAGSAHFQNFYLNKARYNHFPLEGVKTIFDCFGAG